jgi:hypothetical protein
MTSQTGFSEIELKKFSEAGRVISAAVGTSIETWARAEAGVILKTWAGRTKVATQQKTDIRSRLRAIRELGLTGRDPGTNITINAGIKGAYGRVYLRTVRGKWRRTHDANFKKVSGYRGQGSGDHYKDVDWIDIKEAIFDTARTVARMMPQGRRAIGLARQSVVQIADQLGIRLESVAGGGNLSGAGIAKARAAIASNGTRYQNGTAIISDTAKSFYLTLVNRYPKIGPLFMDRTLQGVIAGRIKYFERNLAEGTFLSASRAAKAYPYVEVLRLAA